LTRSGNRPLAGQQIQRNITVGGQDLEGVKESLLDSIYDDVRNLGWPAQAEARELAVPTDYPAALATLQAALIEGGSGGRKADHRSKVWREFEQLLQEQVTGPVMKEAMEKLSPTERTLGLAVAEVSRLFHTKSTLLSAALSKHVADYGIDRQDILPSEQVKEVLAMADRLAKLSREAEKCRESIPVTVIQVLNQPQTPPLALPDYS